MICYTRKFIPKYSIRLCFIPFWIGVQPTLSDWRLYMFLSLDFDYCMYTFGPSFRPKNVFNCLGLSVMFLRYQPLLARLPAVYRVSHFGTFVKEPYGYSFYCYSGRQSIESALWWCCNVLQVLSANVNKQSCSIRMGASLFAVYPFLVPCNEVLGNLMGYFHRIFLESMLVPSDNASPSSAVAFKTNYSLNDISGGLAALSS